MAKIEQSVQDISKKRFYTHAIVSYASIDELSELLSSAKHYAYILHDRDEGRDPHYHILATFDIQRSYDNVRRLVSSKQNTFTQEVKSTVGNVIHYFVHSTDTAVRQGKEPYGDDEVIYDNEDYWRKRALSEGKSWKDEKGKDEQNEQFIKDLLESKMDKRSMAIRYGKDYMRNMRAYEQFKNAVYEDLYNELEHFNDELPSKINPITGEVILRTVSVTNEEYKLILNYRLEPDKYNKLFKENNHETLCNQVSI